MIYGKEKSFITEIDLNKFVSYRMYGLFPHDSQIDKLVYQEIVSPLMKNVKIASMINAEELRLKVRVSYNEVIT